MKKTKNTTKHSDKRLTEVELELMNILWKLGEGSVADVIGLLPSDRDLAYTSVSTILRILEQKEVLLARKEGRGHIYVPVLKKSEYEVQTLQHVVDRVFDGTPVALVKQLLGNMKVNSSEIEEIKKLLNEMVIKK